MHSELGKHDGGGGGGKDCEWKKLNSYHQRNHKLGLWPLFFELCSGFIEIKLLQDVFNDDQYLTLYNRIFYFF